MKTLIKILSILTFAWAILFTLSFVSIIFVIFLVPISFFTFVFFTLSTVVGLFYYRRDRLLFYSHWVLILLAIATYFVPFLFAQNLMEKIGVDYLIWSGRIWGAILILFYGWIIFKKRWVLQKSTP